jgi:hypothetical protein
VLKLHFYAFVPDISRLAEATLVLLRQESSCQQIESDGEDDGDIDHDEVLMDAVSDLLPAFAKVMGSYFDPIFAKLFDPLMKFAVRNSSFSLYAHALHSYFSFFLFLAISFSYYFCSFFLSLFSIVIFLLALAVVGFISSLPQLAWD